MVCNCSIGGGRQLPFDCRTAADYCNVLRTEGRVIKMHDARHSRRDIESATRGNEAHFLREEPMDSDLWLKYARFLHAHSEDTEETVVALRTAQTAPSGN